MNNYPDPSDHPAFYDPDHPANQKASLGPMPRWWVELLCDDGETFGGSYAACTKAEAINMAVDDAKRWGYKPADVDSIEREDDE